MRPWSELVARVRSLLARDSEEREMREEIEFHLAMETEKNVRDGMSPAAAARAARIAFGGTAAIEEETRDARGVRPLEDAARDVRYAVRVLRRDPAFTVTTVLTLALGIGAATAIFGAVYGILLRPLPYREPHRLVALWEHNVPRGKDRNVVAVSNFEAWRERGRSFQWMGALVPAPLTITGGETPERIVGAEVSPGYFAALGVAPALGREFADAEAAGPAADVVILSDALWRRRFGGDRAVLGGSIVLGGRPHTIVGVMPARFDPPRFGWLSEQQLWLPFAPTSDNRGWGRFLLVLARLRPGADIEQARLELAAIAERRAREDAKNVGWSASVVPLAEQITGEVRPALLVLLGAVATLLLIAVANVAMLSLAHARRREHELAIRRAIGATRGRLLRQLLTQAIVLGLAGAAVGLGVAWAGTRALVALLPPEVPRASAIQLDAPVLLAAAGATFLATLAFGIAGALRGANAAPAPGTRASSRLGGGSLVVAELALGLVLTVTAVLMARSFAELRAVDLGFRAERVVVARVALDGARYRDAERRRAFFDELLARMRSVPGVRAASGISGRPFGGIGPATVIEDPARPFTSSDEAPVADVRWIDRDYFRTLQVPLLSGSPPGAEERSSDLPGVVISRSAARALWPSEAAVGKRIAIELFGSMEARVVGVAEDVHLADARTVPRPAAYLSIDRWPAEALDIVVRGDGTTEALAAALRRTVAALDPAIPVYELSTMEAIVDESLARDRFTTLLLAAFAIAALLLAAVGIYGVFAGDVARRRHELGIRRALGARAPAILILVLRRGIAHAIAGIAIGVAGALVVTRAMASLLFGVGAADPGAYVGVAALLLCIAVLATLIPALRAARVSALEVIRVE